MATSAAVAEIQLQPDEDWRSLEQRNRPESRETMVIGVGNVQIFH